MGPSPNHGDRRGQRPALVVIHYTGMADAESARARLCDPLAEVSAHWLIREDGRTEALVPEDRRAWHAGAGSWQGREDVNSRSIGIELANPGDRPFPEPQMAALGSLLRGIMARWDIGPAGVIAHSDMAPGRKTDPGPRFDWRRLALGGLALWPEGLGEDRPLADSLPRIGYPDNPAALSAFRLRFRPWATGPETEDDRRAAAALAYSLANRAESLAASASSP
ncbi:N-acetylmuramoyl-L-alanine amidase [Paracoccus mutanolyticus]|uniref:N-acetylmuramoyl-L-alanine amidase n=1 Tax=Paracoccus mutanolyticus TaxID=1499308 RepID=A0ABM6WSI9_9RHOB|nr:N-acetylmuramoyl-L-alanine amidase [Paracoccus mutanolyticus]AWX93551.1 N-acetylmuramoyl-L-alanine amidase [Paracoccus mutanolyticus]